MACRIQIKPRRYIQFNDLVFDGTESVQVNTSESYAAKLDEMSYTFKSGSYVPVRKDGLIYESTEVGLVLHIPTLRWSAKQIKAHQNFILTQLTRPGKLWAIDPGGELIWAHAIPKTLEPASDWSIGYGGHINIQVTFLLYEAVWHKADPARTFLVDYEMCDFVTVLGSCFQNVACPNACELVTPECDSCHGDIEYDFYHALCCLQDDIMHEFYNLCKSKWRIVWNCEAGYELFGADYMLGTPFCQQVLPDCELKVLVASFFSDSVLLTRDITITLVGDFKDPIIYVNNRKLSLAGEWKGYTMINLSKGLVYNATSAAKLHIEDCREEFRLRDVEVCNDDLYFTYGYNEITVEGVTSYKACVVISHDRKTL